MKQVASSNGKNTEINSELFVQNVEGKNTIGNPTKKVMNVSTVAIAKVYVAIR